MDDVHREIVRFIQTRGLDNMMDLAWMVPDLEKEIGSVLESVREMKDPQNHKHKHKNYATLYMRNKMYMILPLAQFLIDLWVSGQTQIVIETVRHILECEKNHDNHTYYIDLAWVINKLRRNTTGEILMYIHN